MKSLKGNWIHRWKSDITKFKYYEINGAVKKNLQ